MNLKSILIVTLLSIFSLGCLAQPDQRVTTTSVPQIETTSSPPPEHYPKSPRPTTPTTTTRTITPVMETPEITFSSFPAEVEVGSPISIKWMVTGVGQQAAHSAVHYGTESKPGTLSTSEGPGAAGYTSLTTEYASGDFQLPREFTTTITPDLTGAIYLRAHAIVDGKNYWTTEKTVSVKESTGNSGY